MNKRAIFLLIVLFSVQIYASSDSEAAQASQVDVLLQKARAAVASFSFVDALKNGSGVFFKSLEGAAIKYKNDEFARNVTHGALGLCLMYSIMKRSVSKVLIVFLSGLTIYTYAELMAEQEKSGDLQNRLDVLIKAVQNGIPPKSTTTEVGL